MKGDSTIADETGKSPCFKTAQEHDVYLLGLMCGAIGFLRGQCEDPEVMGVEPVEDVLVEIAAYLESAYEFAEKSFETDLKDKLSGTRISVEALSEAWDLGCKNGLQIDIGPMPEMTKPKKA